MKQMLFKVTMYTAHFQRGLKITSLVTLFSYSASDEFYYRLDFLVTPPYSSNF